MLKYIFKYLNRKFLIGLKSKGGRNHLGRVCVKGRGGGNRHLYRIIDFSRRVQFFGTIIKNFYDPNRSSKIGLIIYDNGLTSYITLSEDCHDRVYSGYMDSVIAYYSGWALRLTSIKFFTNINNIELVENQGAQLIRAAGCSGLLIGRIKDKAILKLKSGWQLSVSSNCMATYGRVSNVEHKFKILGKAGVKRSMGFRPKNRGVAKNPCDHPHGGGNGKKSALTVPVNFTGRVKKWTPTTHKKFHILFRRKFLSKI